LILLSCIRCKVIPLSLWAKWRKLLNPLLKLL
jgi:hypothetical protein